MDILLLTKEHCDFCVRAKSLLEHLQAEYGFSLSLLDLQSPTGEALALHHSILFPPGVFLDGKPFSYGRLSERKLRRELDRRIPKAPATIHPS